MKFPGEITVHLATPTRVVDRYENWVDTWTVTPIAGCMFEPAQSTERTDVRSPGVTSPAKAYLPAGAPDISPKSLLVLPPGAHLDTGRLVVDGEAYSVVGKVERWPEVVVALNRWEGPS